MEKRRPDQRQEIECRKQVQGALEFDSCRLDGQQDGIDKISRQLPVNDYGMIQVLAIIQVCGNEGNEHTGQDPPEGFQLGEDAELDPEAQVPDIDEGQGQHVESEVPVPLENRLERLQVEESYGYKNEEQDVHADMDPGQPFPVIRPIHLTSCASRQRPP